MSLEDVHHLLEHPDKESWNSLAATAPAHGLYLSRVCYREEDLRGTAERGAVEGERGMEDGVREAGTDVTEKGEAEPERQESEEAGMERPV